jgi:hypothetical protein
LTVRVAATGGRSRPVKGLALLAAVVVVTTAFPQPTSSTVLAPADEAIWDDRGAPLATAGDRGWHYGFDMAAINGGAGMDDAWHGRPSVAMAKAPECDSSCQAGKNVQRTMDYYHWRNEHNGHCILGYEYDFAKLDGWLSFARGIGPSLDPFQPAANDAVNLSSDSGLYGIYCDVHQHANKTSNYDIWLVNFYDGVGSGGWGYQLLFLVLSIVLPFGVAKLGGALVGMLADAVVEESATAVADGTMIAARAGMEAAESAATSTARASATELEQNLAKESEAILQDEGGSPAMATRAEEDMQANLESLASEAGVDAGAPASEKVGAIIGSGESKEVTALKAANKDLDVPANQRAFEVAAKNGIQNNFRRFAARYTAATDDVEGAINDMKAAQFPARDIDGFFGMSEETTPIHLKAVLGERAMVADKVSEGLDPALVEEQATRDLSEIAGEGNARADAVFHGDPPQLGEAKYYSWDTFRHSFQSLWKSGKTGSREIQKLLRDRELYAATDEVYGSENRILSVPGDTYRSLVSELVKNGAEDGAAAAKSAFNSIGWTIKPLHELDVARLARALGIVGAF